MGLNTAGVMGGWGTGTGRQREGLAVVARLVRAATFLPPFCCEYPRTGTGTCTGMLYPVEMDRERGEHAYEEADWRVLDATTKKVSVSESTRLLCT